VEETVAGRNLVAKALEEVEASVVTEEETAVVEVVLEVAGTETDQRCTKQLAATVVRNVKFLSDQRETNRFSAVTVFETRVTIIHEMKGVEVVTLVEEILDHALMTNVHLTMMGQKLLHQTTKNSLIS
jgi:hypothetical protein